MPLARDEEYFLEAIAAFEARDEQIERRISLFGFE